MSKENEITVIKEQSFPLCGLFCAEVGCGMSPCFVANAKVCCCSVKIGWAAAVAGATAYYASGEAGTESKGGKAAAALAAMGIADQLDDSAVTYGCESCYTEEQGCCEVSSKLACLWLEVQFPPGADIGLACCGARCMDNAAEAREGAYAPLPEERPRQQAM
mmetsp:Transcript_5045/g.14740  ORF Transcript_5045/g.14740 Transcript_5045/m.14740 type:complete len:162 (-) Transcript_5045:9-494(-)